MPAIDNRMTTVS